MKVLGAETHFLGDGIRRAFEARVSRPPSYGFSHEALISRRQILQAACETLANSVSRRDYNQALLDDERGTIITQVPWDKVCFHNLGVVFCLIAEEMQESGILRWKIVLINVGSWGALRSSRSRRGGDRAWNRGLSAEGEAAQVF